MDSIGTEVGQKMRSAIRAKLMELGCYVDDELPDYVMVMVANKRTRSQMEDDLQLFLRAHTKAFVDWLQQVLRKLKEVTIANPEMYACTSLKDLKRKASIEITESVIKKEKKLRTEPKPESLEVSLRVASITDEIPVQATKLVERRQQNNRLLTSKVKIESEKLRLNFNEDNFDIPSIAEVHDLEDCDLDLVESRIKEARSRIVLMKSDSEDEDCLNIGADTEELLGTELDTSTNSKQDESSNTKLNTQKYERQINLKNNKLCTISNSVQLNNDVNKRTENIRPKRTIRLTETLREEQEISGRIRSSIQNTRKIALVNNKRESVHKRLGLPSSVVALPKNKELSNDIVGTPKSVMSVVQVKPRKVQSNSCPGSKNLLLKAMAEAQKSIIQASTKVNAPKDALFTRKYRETHNMQQDIKIHLKESTDAEHTSKIQNVIELKGIKSNANKKNKEKDNQYLSEPITNDSEYVSSTIDLNCDQELNDYTDEEQNEIPLKNQQFIITLDGLKDPKIQKASDKPIKRIPSPIIFDKTASVKIPDELTKVHIPMSLKTKERCKYWPGCRLKDSCDYIHPSAPCKVFPLCKFGDRCLYVHPKCKFYTSCTRKECPYSHGSLKLIQKLVPKPAQEVCKYYPNCSNKHCHFFHPQLCRFGKYCSNKYECNYSHNFLPNKDKLTWHSNA